MLANTERVLSHMTFLVKDTQESLSFYTKVLGFQRIASPHNVLRRSQVNDMSDNDGSVWIHDSNTKLCFRLLQSTQERPLKNATLITIGMAHLEETEHALTTLSYAFKKETRDGFLELYMTDPDGLGYCLTNRISPYSTRFLDTEARLTPSLPLMTTTPTTTTGRQAIAMLTSGGDSPGMNAAVRAIVRVALHRKCDVYAIYEGYQGLIDGKIEKFEWNSVTGILGKGGTVIGTARCKAFHTRQGRLSAAHNLIVRGITGLVAIGGDGTLTGADTFRAEWPSLVEELCQSQRISPALAHLYRHFNIVGLVGSIDNDLSGTDFTIGCTSALHRIVEAVDAVTFTAMSHHRCFIIEVMGRHCGWLALMSGMATGADWLFVPEFPPGPGWEARLCETLRQQRQQGRHYAIVIVSEGAIDSECRPISSEQVKHAIQDDLKWDTRVTILGHVQRGGTACAFDRTMATLVATEAVEVLLTSQPESPAWVIGIRENHLCRLDLRQAVADTRSVAEAVRQRQFDKVVPLRGPEFMDAHKTFMATALLNCHSGEKEKEEKEGKEEGKERDKLLSPSSLRLAILHTGAPAAGMNPATRIAVRLATEKGHTVLGVYNGFRGLMAGDLKPLNRIAVDDWAARGGSELGTNRSLPSDDYGLVAQSLGEHAVDGLLVMGGFEAYLAVHELASRRDDYPQFCIPMVCLPATVSNNVPGTEYSLGADTALNAIVEACDRLKQSATSSRRRTFVVEVQGGQCGYLATVGGIAAGCASSYIPEEGLDFQTLAEDLSFLVHSSKNKIEGRVILRNETVSELYTTEFIARFLTLEAKGAFDGRPIVLGHLQQGGSPSPLDRVRGARLATLCIDYLERQACATPLGGDEGSMRVYGALRAQKSRVYVTSSESASIIGLKGSQIVFTPVKELVSQTHMKLRRPKHQWWMALRPLLKLLSSDPSSSTWPLPTTICQPDHCPCRQCHPSSEPQV